MIQILLIDTLQSVFVPHNGTMPTGLAGVPDGASLYLKSRINNTEINLADYCERVHFEITGKYCLFQFTFGANKPVAGEYEYQVRSDVYGQLLASGVAIMGEYQPQFIERETTIEYEQY